MTITYNGSQDLHLQLIYAQVVFNVKNNIKEEQGNGFKKRLSLLVFCEAIRKHVIYNIFFAFLALN